VLQPSLYADAQKVLGVTRLVAVNDHGAFDGVCRVCPDEEAIGRMAAAHLMNKRLRHFAVFRFNDGAFAIERERAFVAAIREQKKHLVCGWWKDRAVPPRDHEDPGALVAWLRALPRPCGVFACTDSWARVVARYAEVADLKIPEDIALIGVDNDTVDCELSNPPLCSVAVPWVTVGRLAAELALRQCKESQPVQTVLTVAPIDVIPRRSTEVTAVADPLVLRAVTFITDHLERRLTLRSIARSVSSSRQRLEERFRVAIGRSVMQEVRRVRVDAARQLLSTTGLTLPRVAERTGFSTAALLSVAFRREVGMPPGLYRRRLQGLGREDEDV
jgi:LacI family transcriptional regulator